MIGETPMAKAPKNDPPDGDPPTKRRGGPPKGSQNALRHGLYAGKLSKGLGYVEKRINAFRRIIEQQVVASKGSISMTDAACINSACKWERHGCLAQDWLRKEAAQLSPSDRLKFSEAIAKASDNRDRNLRQLGLDVKQNVWESLSKPPRITDVEE